MSGTLGLTQQDVLNFVLYRLGSPAIAVHVTPQQIQNEMIQVLDVLSRRKPRVKFTSFAVTAGNQNYTPDPSQIGYGILSVGLPRIDPIAPLLLSSGPRLDIFGYRYSYPYRDISELEIDYVYFDMATRILSSDIDYEYIDGQIWIYPAPQDNFQAAYAWAAPKILGDDISQTPTTIGQQDWDWVRDTVFARSKILEGLILRRYGGAPGAQAPIRTDGAELVEEGERLYQEKIEDLESRTPEVPFIKSSSLQDLPLNFG